MTSPSEPEEVLRLYSIARSGDSAATTYLYQKHAKAVRSAIRKSGVPQGTTMEDLEQEVFIAAFHERATYEPRPGSTFEAWLCGIARNRVRAAHRRTPSISFYPHEVLSSLEETGGLCRRPESGAPDDDELRRISDLAQQHLDPGVLQYQQLRDAGIPAKEALRRVGCTAAVLSHRKNTSRERFRRALASQDLLRFATRFPSVSTEALPQQYSPRHEQA